MKNFNLMENQMNIKHKSHLFLTKEPDLPDFKGKNIPFLSNVSENGLAELMLKAKTVRYVRKEVIASEGNPNSLFLLFLGKISVNRIDAEKSTEVKFQIQEPSSSFSEIALLTDDLRSVSIVTLENTVFSVILKTDFNDWLRKYLDVKLAFLPVLNERLNS
jgi:CRP/FNR family transcriptional regulator, cyclic AMP receptor protein